MLIMYESSRIDTVNWQTPNGDDIKLYVKRDDLIHPIVSGNKWRKLQFSIAEAKNAGQDTLLTFGGAYSNHIVATAFACKDVGLKSIGIIRGDELNPDSNETLRQAKNFGMDLVFVDRETYEWRHERSYHQELWELYGSFYLVPEGRGQLSRGYGMCADSGRNGFQIR